MESDPLEGCVDDLVIGKQVGLLPSLLFISLMLIIGYGLGDVVALPLLILLLPLHQGLRQHFLLDKRELCVHRKLRQSILDNHKP